MLTGAWTTHAWGMARRDVRPIARCRRSGAAAIGLTGLLMLSLSSCGSDDESSASTAAAPAVALEGTMWELTPGVDIGADVEGVAVSAHFANFSLTGTSGCNDYTTTYVVDGTKLTIGPDIASTQKACPEPETAVEQAYLERLPKVDSYSIAGDVLTLSDDSGTAILEYKAINGAEAIVGSWNVISYYAGNAVTSVVGGVELTTEFTATEISGNSGCNTFSGTYQVDGDKIEIGPLASTLKACSSDELQQQEANYLAALGLAETFTVTGNRLDLYRSDGGYAATLERAE
jgi:heat shock protein HslJ